MFGFIRGLFTLKYISLALLVLQNTFLVVFMGYSRTEKSVGPMYASSTAVVSMELVKFFSCFAMVAYERGGIIAMLRCLDEEIVKKPMNVLILSVPAICYSVQNNLLYYALSHLDATTFQVGYQLKLLTTAVFSYFMLNKRLSNVQWFSLVVLTVGVILAQLSASKPANEHSSTMLGFFAVLGAACLSGFAGVYFERVVRSSATSLWIRNIELGISSIIAAFLGVWLSGDVPQIRKDGFFSGYNKIVIFVILLQSFGGLIVAVVVKYADNILKGFAASFSILTSCVLCYFYFDFVPNIMFLSGAALVNVSMYLYSLPSTQKRDATQNNGEKKQLSIETRATMAVTTTDVALLRAGKGGGAGGVNNSNNSWLDRV